MGTSKANLPFGAETMLTRMVQLLTSVVQPIVVVAAVDQELPQLPAEVLIARDAQPERGPLMGLASGLTMLADQVDAVFVTACDVPLLHPQFISAMMEQLGSHAIAIPQDETRFYPLTGVYCVSVLSQIQALLAANQGRVSRLFELVSTRFVPSQELRKVDPELHSLLNLNTPDDYQRALKIAGYAP